jgi:hypothetical protein
MAPIYHVGKLTKEISTTVTDEFGELLADRARAANCKPSDLMREGLYLLLTGATYSAHVSKDMSAAFEFPHGKQAENSAPNGVLKP